MRKSYYLILAVLGGILLAGCGADGAPQPTAVVTPAATSTTAVTPAPTFTALPTQTVQAVQSSPTEWVPPTALVGTPILGAQATLTAAPKLATKAITLVNAAGEKSVMTVEVADTEPSRELGLMFRPNMDPDAGMLFDFGLDTDSGFWMQNTILPLIIAFIQADGTIIDVEDMQPLDTTGINPTDKYRYALETNQGYFRAHNIARGDKVLLSPDSSAVIPGMPNCAAK